MINMATVNAAVLVILQNELTGYTLTRAGYMNMDPEKCPWIGIYRGPAGYTPKTLGSNRSGKKWAASNVVRIQAQAASAKSGIQAEERLETYIGEITAALLTDPTLGGTVSTIVGIDVEYSFNDEQSESMYWHMATIDIKVESRT